MFMSHNMALILEVEVEEATEEEEEEEDVDVGVAVDAIHIINHIIMMKASLINRANCRVKPIIIVRVLWVLVVAPVEDIGVVGVVVVVDVEIITEVMEIIGNVVVDMIVKMVPGGRV